MFKHALKMGLIIAALGFYAQDANAFYGRWGCGWGGYGMAGCGWGACAVPICPIPVCAPPVCGPVCGWGGYGGWGYGGYVGYGYGGWGGWGFSAAAPVGYPVGYLANSRAQSAATIAARSGASRSNALAYSGRTSNSVASTGLRSAARPLVRASQPTADTGLLTINVPADAKVFVNDKPTTSTGPRRQYKSSGLQPDSVYRYHVRAEFVRDGEPVTEEKTVELTGGKSISIAFNIAPAAPEAQVAEMAKTEQR